MRRTAGFAAATTKDLEMNQIAPPGTARMAVNGFERDAIEISECEQQRLGREIHDGMCQSLTGVLFIGKAVSDRLKAKALAESADVDKIVGLVQEALAQARRLSISLHPIEKASEGLADGLIRLAAAFTRSHGAECIADVDSAIRITDENQAANLYRIAQEALSNCAKHSGAKHVRIYLGKVKGRLALEIRDDGRGIPAEAPDISCGMGLRLMQYRARIANASLEIKRLNGKGTLVRCLLPNKTQQKARQL
jgi:signal transduction histidine kinase